LTLLPSSNGAAGLIIFLVAVLIWLVMVALIVFMFVCLWRIFTKADEPGWSAIVPLYNTIQMIRLAGKEIWWIALLFIPGVNLVVSIMIMIAFAKAFGKSEGFGVGLALLPFVFFPILAFGNAQYIGTKTPL